MEKQQYIFGCRNIKRSFTKRMGGGGGDGDFD